MILSTVESKVTGAKYFYNSQRPLIIAHRGASGYVPEHTLQAYEMAAYMGADFIEPDLVPTKDGYLMINHENLLNDTTDVSNFPIFKDLLKTKTITTPSGSTTQTGWFSEDFTLSQIKQLRAKQRLPLRPSSFNYLFPKITIDEALDWTISLNKKRIADGIPLLGVYIELKHPSYFNSIGLPVENMLLKILKKRNIDTIKGASSICPIILQCFELESLKYLSKYTDLPLVFLISSSDSAQYNISEYSLIVSGVGPDIPFVFDRNGAPTGFVQEAHRYGIAVHLWTIRDDVPFFGLNRKLTYSALASSQIDGVFDEFPDSASVYFSLSN
jgi:glycerophosphoryl diester phosphodiesterase